jgi:alkylation response protein AidB-like acyl-CoA dehydrogenase
MISFELTEEQSELERTARRFFEQYAPVTKARELMTDETGFDREVWQRIGGQLGLLGVHLPEHYGGAGYGYVELGVVLCEMGRVLYSGPFLSSAVMASEAILLSGDEAAAAEFLPSLASGEEIGALAVAERAGVFAESDVKVRAVKGNSGWTLCGRKPLVLHGDVATLLIVAARSDVGVSLFVVDVEAPGLTRRAVPAFDQTRHLAVVDLDSTPARMIGQEGLAWPALDSVFDRASVALACEALGVAERSLEVALEYAKARIQFNRPIGSFQAVKHKFADMLVALELARSAAEYSTRAVDAGADDIRMAASIALSQCAEACLKIAGESIQIHGGIGFTWEHDAHLYFKRARAEGALLGTVEQLRERLLESLGI